MCPVLLYTDSQGGGDGDVDCDEDDHHLVEGKGADAIMYQVSREGQFWAEHSVPEIVLYTVLGFPPKKSTCYDRGLPVLVPLELSPFSLADTLAERPEIRACVLSLLPETSLLMSSKINRDAAVACLSSLLTRPDMEASHLRHFLEVQGWVRG